MPDILLGMQTPFYLALNMAGTVSAGAYSAGVMDFLIEAMDAWYAAKATGRTDLPPHDVKLAALTGASGGGMTAALATVELTRAPGQPSLMRKAWVQDIDIRKLLTLDDLKGDEKVQSLLNSLPVQTIAEDAIQKFGASQRLWAHKTVRVALTLTNLGGVPYRVSPGDDSPDTTYHADFREFDLGESSGEAGVIELSPPLVKQDGWLKLQKTAVATGAFPLFLAAQKLVRPASDYNARQWEVPLAEPNCDEKRCTELAGMPPHWDKSGETLVTTWNVDGGATNNNPLDRARLFVSKLDPPLLNLRASRHPESVDRAVISIAPLYTEVKPETDIAPPGLEQVTGRLLQVLLTQSRLQGENLWMSASRDVPARWMISPKSHLDQPLAGSRMNAFGAFLSEDLRKHDYQLGRRNCQRFLMQHFRLPWTHKMIGQPGNLAALKAEWSYGDPSLSETFPLIPLVTEQLRSKIERPSGSISESQIEEISRLAAQRGVKVALKILTGLPDLAVRIFSPFVSEYLKDKINDYARKELADFLNGS